MHISLNYNTNYSSINYSSINYSSINYSSINYSIFCKNKELISLKSFVLRKIL